MKAGDLTDSNGFLSGLTKSGHRLTSRGATVLDELHDLQVGVKLKHARRVKGMRLKELADMVGCSEGFLSKVENDKVRPSLQMLHSIVSILDTSIGELFSAQADDKHRIMRVADRPTIGTAGLRSGPGITLESLVPAATMSLLFGSIHVVEPGGSSDGKIEHKGEEIGYILQGDLELTIEDTTYFLHPGDSFFFQSHLPHGYRNPGKVTTKVVWINTPPTF
ncbi:MULTISPECIES: cupin domain-containing protein [unclassified Caballeronia]|uniref:cupin domain-containing protein n=1 Tax=unclassified Caballeronia TaxID=2646786 RepID=UPI001F39CBD1|nr:MULTISPECIES: cupin domain-containing protein [unclassified Caballeronia]MCE4547300.1 cupin domain-containing protein [Caballeronia sp. PC1]MCE4575283.1 cupin domain-containing protein [Caballeronia sp. CLC5]